MQIVEARLVVVVVTAIAERVCGAHLEPTVGRVIHLENVAPSVVYIFDKTTERRVRSSVIRAPDFNYIALKILLVLIIVSEVVHSDGAARCVIEEVNIIEAVAVRHFLRDYIRPVKQVTRLYSAEIFHHADSVFIIRISRR